MRNLFTVVIITAALAMSGCTWQTFVADLQGAEAKAAAVIQKIKAKQSVIDADLEAAASFVCSKLPAADSALAAIRQKYGPAPGPKTTKALNVAGASLGGVTTFCANPHATARQTLMAAWNGIQAGVAAINAADAAAGQ